ncbi:MAG: 5'-methylthioadenosine/S-adenosylhomocysteine nucleosidase [Hoeflea sp.]|uniref:5'-methylthioadenosine/S-adenosylhomocysteine nucleosidase n=1 Tax=Hoeflea sp. TaxID=1940281 RepID=UPI001E137237|nr:5'-methylthioadenosine/S-adenosylhomocysteine nucleosidase [Hoeflea sp.]MBU4531686.1 5'-methylthioadenosine/S-adenosylhomocysteine nucleosidase [Alphaproteobacteria bacterium]MBU4544542.1 5'-methylthioadenosine/S-adenosylhomocysteine nucleosidase [Alphaproteobacteria bacterium]MBU4552773.1 5'-methylthioadenosine/S-adenosylhomocysteine nucleosidase [Alphaproteobacteria bacterium]MBV1724962.1 5'-methylthioadenosine/S-adenosylhomocysteine nucleosidase [Hoeflea sp.]MBV1760982.1 5'-methylthioade
MRGEIKTVGGRRILYVMAAEPEYGPHLKSRFEPLMTGVGPVEAAGSVAASLSALGSGRPDCIVCLGSAGSRLLEQTRIYQVSSVSYRDMDASPLGFEKGRTPFLDLPATLILPVIADGVASASLSTGANIVSGAAYDAIDAEMVDMETFAVVRAASLFAVPVIGLRGISDGKAELTHIDNWTEFLHVIDENLAQAVDRVEAAIASGAVLA